MLSTQIKTKASKGYLNVEHCLVLEMTAKSFTFEKPTILVSNKDGTLETFFNIVTVLDCFRTPENEYKIKIEVSHPDIASFFNSDSMMYGVKAKKEAAMFVESFVEYNQFWEDSTYKWFV